MQWLKTWLMKWLGIDEVRAENAELIQRLDIIDRSLVRLSLLLGSAESAIGTDGVLIENLGNRMMPVEQKLEFIDRRTDDLFTRCDAFRADLIDTLKLGERDEKRISELELIVKDATLDTALAAIEDRIAKLEATPAPAPGPQGRRGGSAWNSHQVAASAGAALANGVPLPIPTPGVS